MYGYFHLTVGVLVCYTCFKIHTQCQVVLRPGNHLYRGFFHSLARGGVHKFCFYSLDMIYASIVLSGRGSWRSFSGPHQGPSKWSLRDELVGALGAVMLLLPLSNHTISSNQGYGRKMGYLFLEVLGVLCQSGDTLYFFSSGNLFPGVRNFILQCDKLTNL